MTELLTASRLRVFRACPRMHSYMFDRCIRPLAADSSLRFGTLFHDGVEQWRRARMEGLDPVELGLAAMQARWSAIEEPDEFEIVRAMELFAGYHLRWQDEPYRWLAVEAEFRFPLVNPDTGRRSPRWMVAGKIDGIAEDTRDGSVWLVENKTSSEDISAGSPYWQRLRIDSQLSVYYDGARSLGFDISGVLYDVALRPQHRPKLATPEESRKYTAKGFLYANQREADETPAEFAARIHESIAEDPDKYFARGTVVRLDSELEMSRRCLWQTAKQMRETRDIAEGLFNPSACFDYNRPCAFFDVCTGAASLGDDHRYHVVTNAHPELSTAIQSKEETQDDQDSDRAAS